MTGAMTPAIEVAGLSKSYWMGGVCTTVLRRVDLRIRQGEFVALTGSSGSGKSTLMNILGCLDAPDAGQVYLGGREVTRLAPNELARERNRRIGFVFQSFQLVPRASAWANVAQPLIYRGVPPTRRRELAREALHRVGLSDRAEHRPSELSGGQRQRVAIARALVGQPLLVLADEPTGSLDSTTANEVMDLFAAINAAGTTLIIVTHDAAVAARSGRVIRLRDGRVDGESALPQTP